MIEFSQVSKSFGGKRALDSVSFEVEEGKTSILLGTSGSGKSTILRLITGLIEADSGTITVRGKKLSRTNIEEFRKTFGYVIQEGGLFPHMTAKDNVSLMAKYYSWDENRIRQRMSELAKLMSLPEDLLGKFPSQLSGGQRQRVSLMRALMLDPELLLLDEPLGALDPITRHDLQDQLKEIFANLGKTVVIVTHDLAEADCLGHQTFLLNHGKIIQRGSLKSMASNPNEPFVKRFIEAQRPAITI